MPQQCRPNEGRLPFDDVRTVQIFPGKLAFITSGQRIGLQHHQPTVPPRIVQAGLAGWLVRWLVRWLVDAGLSMPACRSSRHQRAGLLAGWLGGWVAGWLVPTSRHQRVG